MKKLLNAIFIVFLAALGAGIVLYLDKNASFQQTKEQQYIDAAVARYINDNSQEVLEKMAKSERFGTVIKSFSAVSDEEVANKIHNYIANNPAALEEYIRNNASYVAASVLDTDEFRNAIKNSLSDDAGDEQENAEKAKTILEHWNEMRNGKVAPFVGPSDARVAVVEFFDFSCGHCRDLAPVMAQLVKDNPDVKFVFQPLYFIGEHSNYAAKVAVAAAKKGKFLEVFEGIMTLPEMNVKNIDQILTDEGLDVREIKTMIEEKEIRRGLQDIDGLSQVLGINGVPTIIINGELFQGRSLGDLQNEINRYK